MTMTIPMMVMIISAVIWLLLRVVLPPTSGDQSPRYPEFHAWLIDICRILFAVSALVVLYNLVNKTIF